MPSFRSTFPRLPNQIKALAFACLFVIAGVGNSQLALGQTPAPGDVVFSQIYTGGGAPGSAYKDNFLELFNRSNAAVDISGMPFHITSDTGQFFVAVSFRSSQGLIIQPGGYLLIQFQTNGTSGAPLPLPDLFVPVFSQFSFGLSPSGKIALATPGTFITTCTFPNPGVMDFVGYGGTANCFEGTGPTATLAEASGAIRKSSGCADTNDNSSDFFVSAPNPRNRFWPWRPCSANVIDEPDFFSRQHYADFLNREPDPSGLAFWSRQIASCGNNQACADLKRINVSGAFFLSIEFQETGFLVYRTYKAAFGNLPNSPVPLLRDEFLPDTQQIGQGVVVDAPGWELQLAHNKNAFFQNFVSRMRFVNLYPATVTPAQFADALFATAGVTPSANERSAVMNEFGGAADTSDIAARARALRLVAEGSSLSAQEKNKAFVLMQYFGYLKRNPNDFPEATLDFTGYNFWLNKLNQFNGNFVAAEMVKAFITSGEYRQRF